MPFFVEVVFSLNNFALHRTMKAFKLIYGNEIALKVRPLSSDCRHKFKNATSVVKTLRYLRSQNNSMF